MCQMNEWEGKKIIYLQALHRNVQFQKTVDKSTYVTELFILALFMYKSNRKGLLDVNDLRKYNTCVYVLQIYSITPFH